MNDEKRNCIFTNLPADSKIVVSSSKQNWTKAVPCTKKFKESKQNSELTDLEFKLVELFIQKELALLKVEHFENKMNKIRSLLSNDYSFELKKQDIDLLDIKIINTISLTSTEKEDKIKETEEIQDLWNNE